MKATKHYCDLCHKEIDMTNRGFLKITKEVTYKMWWQEDEDNGGFKSIKDVFDVCDECEEKIEEFKEKLHEKK